MAKQQAKKASVKAPLATPKAQKTRAKVEKKAPEVQEVQEVREVRVLKKALIITGVRRYERGSEVTPEMEKAWVDYYRGATGGPPIREISWYC
jgi:hypothetical protein